ncbi:MAG: gliding motility-associated C-terminal domain-containing protein [Bacteroidales bacterium]|jgi:gliding motility-associated-like protein|nr:gliding motility-associated C-terminal domain-containing protein [Bacteroidales bacterium]
MKYFLSCWMVIFAVGGNVWGAFDDADDAPASKKRIRKAITVCGWGASFVSSSTSCPEISNGKIRIDITGNPSGGDYSRYSVKIDGGAAVAWGTLTGEDSLIITGLSSGEYEVEVWDGSACKTSQYVEVAATALNIEFKNPKNLCPGTVKSGGFTPSITADRSYTQTWYLNSALISKPANTRTLDEGEYKIVLRDSAKCTASNSIILHKLAPFTGTLIPGGILCDMENSGYIEIDNLGGGTIVGGVHQGNYLFEVRNALGWSKTYQDLPITGLPAGDFIVRIKEDSVASASCYMESAVTIDSLDNLNTVTKASAVPVTRCDFDEGKGDGKIILKATNPSGSYFYWYSNMAAGTMLSFLDDSDGDPLQATIENLPLGKYKVVIQEATGCTSDTLDVEVKVPDLKINTTTINTPTCLGRSDGTVEGKIDDGHPPFKLELLDGGKPWYAEEPEFPEDILDHNPFEIKKLTGGKYLFLVADAAACVDTAEIEIDAPQLVQFTLDSIAPNCSDDPLIAAGAIIYEITELTPVTGPPSYPPSTETFAVYLDAQETFHPAEIKDTIQNLTSGIYEVAVRVMTPPLEQCIGLDTIELKAPEPPVVLPVADETSNPTCVGLQDGKYAFTINSPASVYEYLLSNQEPGSFVPPAGNWKRGYNDVGANQTAVGDITINTTSIHYIIDRYEGHYTGLDTGTYYLWIRDTVTHCIYSEPIRMEKEQRLALSIDSLYRIIDGRLCELEVDLTATVSSVDEATSAPYIWEMSKDGGALAPLDHPELIIIDNPDKKHKIPVRFHIVDAVGCSIDSVFTVVMPRPVKVDVLNADTSVVCNQDAEGYIKLKGDEDNYQYAWKWENNERQKDKILSVTDSVGSLMAGSYSVHVRDSLGVCYFDSIFHVNADHYVEPQITNPDGKTKFCPDEIIHLLGTITIDKQPFVPLPAMLLPVWQMPDGDSIDYITNREISFEADAYDPDSTIILKAAYPFDDATCISRDTFTFTLMAAPELEFSADTAYVPLNESYPLEVTASPDAIDYLWSSIPAGHTGGLPQFPEILSTVYLNHPDRGYYLYLELTAANTCVARDSVYIDASRDFFIPNAFTPNGDGIHDLWKFYPLEQYALFYTVEVAVFSRAGAPVYHRKEYSNDPSVAFDGRKGGKDLPIGTYYYVVKLIHRQTKAEEVYTGSVTIIR